MTFQHFQRFKKNVVDVALLSTSLSLKATWILGFKLNLSVKNASKKKLLLPSTRWSTEKYLFYEGEGLIRGLGCRRGRRRGRDLWHNINAWNYGFGWKMMKRHTSCTCLFIHRIFVTRGGGRCKRIYGTMLRVCITVWLKSKCEAKVCTTYKCMPAWNMNYSWP